MLYYYVNTGHKIGLDRVKRAAALLKRLEANGVEGRMLVNDFRAGLVAKALGIKDYVTIETIQDIDAIAQNGDNIIIDSPEDDRGRLVKYCSDFKTVFRFEQHPQDEMRIDEIMCKIECDNESCVSAVIIDDDYFEETVKEERTLFFLGDADYDKVILANGSFFEAFNMELLLGNYFFVKYEDDLAKLFSMLHEPEEYVDLIKSSSCVVTASAQTALEAKASGAKVIFLNISNNSLYPVALLASYGIAVVEGFDAKQLKFHLQNDAFTAEKKIQKFDHTKILSKL